MGKLQTFHFQSKDFDEISAHLSRWNQSYRQLSAGIFHGDILYLEFDGIEIFELHWGQVIHYQGLTPPGTIGFGLPQILSGNSRYMNRAVSNNDLLVQRSGCEGDLIGSREFKIQVLTIDEQKFFDKVEAVTGLDNRLLLKNVNNIELSPFTAASMRTHFHNLLHMASAKPAVKNMMMVNISQLVEILLEEIASVVVSGNIDLLLPRLSRQRQLVQKAKDYICIRPSIPPRIDDMCAEIGTSERSLRDAFKSCTGISAGAYLKAFRLNQVRTILKTGSPKTIQVQDVAFNWGFSHMGQFAADYKNLFGEPPSKTLSSGKDKQYAVS